MSTQYRCRNEQRHDKVAEARLDMGDPNSKYRLNGLDYLEVDPDNQQKLILHFINKLSDVNGYTSLTKDSFAIAGGVRIINIDVIDPVVILPKAVHLIVDQAGDFSTYKLRIVAGKDSNKPPVWMDPMLSEIDFSFKINCSCDFDCRPSETTPALQIDEPAIDYMARDYNSFRRLMLDRMGFLLPGWQERNPADIGVALVELLAYAGDRLSYKQDAVATEAYLGTALNRISLIRHARLLDYPVSDGANSRVWVQVQIKTGGDGIKIKGPDEAANNPGSALITKIDSLAPVLTLTEAKLATAVANGACFFEAMHTLALYEAHNEMTFYTWGNEGCMLPEGSTQAYLQDNIDGRRLVLRTGDVLIFEEKRSPETGLEADADPARRHAVRLTYVNPEAKIDEAGNRTPGALTTDPLFPGQAFVEINWHEEDALPFDLCIHNVADPDNPGQDRPVCIAAGNILLADHGQTISEEIPVVSGKRFRPALTHSPLTRQGRIRLAGKNGSLVPFDPAGSASSVMTWPANEIIPAIRLIQADSSSLVWNPRRDLLASNAYSREFVVETREDGVSLLRFGDDLMGQKPDANLTFQAYYRIGNGIAGNVGAESLAHLVIRTESGLVAGFDPAQIKKVRNPLSARGGVEAESCEQIRKYAPEAFKIQERAVNAPDYAAIVMRHADIQQAAATVRWTGSWYTVYVTIDRKGGRSVDEAFIAEIKTSLDCYRMAGYDIEINGPRFVPLDIACNVFVKPGYFKMDVKKVLIDTFSNRDLSSGARGFFHPDNFTFGEAVYTSRIYAAAMAIDGIDSIEIKKFQRQGKNAAGEIAKGRLSVGRLEVIRLDNDPNFPENGKIEFDMREANV
ncbi:MAG: baseplate J/gp47 family protein [Smithella sp.]